MIRFRWQCGWGSTAYLTAASTLLDPSDGIDPLTAPMSARLPAVFYRDGAWPRAGTSSAVRQMRPQSQALGSAAHPQFACSSIKRTGHPRTGDRFHVNGEIGYVHMSYLTRA